MKAPLAGEDRSPALNVIAATDYVAPSLEILDTRIQRKDPNVRQEYETSSTRSADNAANAGIALGDQRHARSTPMISAGSARSLHQE